MCTMEHMAKGRRTQEERKAETREKLLAAAARVFARKGFHRASVDEVAEEAGYSIGALYANFAGKEGLFLALLDSETERRGREYAEALAEQGSIDARVRDGARRWMEFLDRSPELMLLFMEFWAYAVRSPEVRPLFAERYANSRATATGLIADGARDFGLELSVPAEQLAIAVDALADGLALQKLADPDAVPEDLFERVLSLLFSAASRS